MVSVYYLLDEDTLGDAVELLAVIPYMVTHAACMAIFEPLSVQNGVGSKGTVILWVHHKAFLQRLSDNPLLHSKLHVYVCVHACMHALAIM